MVRIRGRGKKFPTNFTKIAILLLLRDVDKPSVAIYSGPKFKKTALEWPHGISRSTAEIIDYLKEKFVISEPKGIRLHLEWLYKKKYLNKTTKSGIESRWEWNKSLESFKKIVDFIEINSNLVEQIATEPNFKPNEIIDEENKQNLRDFFKFSNPPFDITRYWYYTKYTRSFLNEKMIDYFVDKAYLKYCSSKNKSQLKQCPDKQSFVHQLLGYQGNEVIVKLMYYSPSLVKHIMNLEQKFEDILDYRKLSSQNISLLVINDLLKFSKLQPNRSMSINGGIQKLDDQAQQLEIKLICNLTEHSPDMKSEMMKNANS